MQDSVYSGQKGTMSMAMPMRGKLRGVLPMLSAA